MATSQYYNPYQGDTNWADYGGLNVPVFSQSDFQWNQGRPDQLKQFYDQQRAAGTDHYLYQQNWDPNNQDFIQGLEQQWRNSQGDMLGNYNGPAVDRGMDATWEFTPEAQARLKAGGWDFDNSKNMRLNQGYQGDRLAWTGNGLSTDPNANWQDLVRSTAYKNSASTGRQFAYGYDPESGQLVPYREGPGVNFITNESETGRMFAASLASMVLGGAAAMYTAPAGAAAQAGSLSSNIAQGAQAANMASKGLSMYGAITDNPNLMKYGAYGSAASGLVGAGAGLYGAADTGNWADAISKGYSAYQNYDKLNNLMNPEAAPTRASMGTGRPTNYGTGSDMPTATTQQNPEISPERTWLDQAFGVGAGVYSDVQNREAFRNLNDLFSRREAARQPYEEMLARSYADGGKGYLESDAYQAKARIEQNKLDRGAAKAGRLANDYDRDLGMQEHALANLENYRAGLRSSLAQESLPYEIFTQAQNRNANAGGPTMAGLGYSGVLQNILSSPQGQSLLKQYGPQAVSFLKNLFGGGGSDPTTGAPSMGGYGEGWGDQGWEGTNFNPNDTWGTDFGSDPTGPMSDPYIQDLPANIDDLLWEYGGAYTNDWLDFPS